VSVSISSLTTTVLLLYSLEVALPQKTRSIFSSYAAAPERVLCAYSVE